ncbi:MAG TPA: response regulator [Draconibacterium sp.]|nr:response regulator [Draconibacterium sp.]
MKILLAEDDIINQKLFSYMLKGIASELLIASTGTEAIKLYKENADFDLILMDLKMPEMDGHEAARNIREMDAKIKIFALSAYDPGTQNESIRKNGFNDYLAKPIRKDALLKAINEHL